MKRKYVHEFPAGLLPVKGSRTTLTVRASHYAVSFHIAMNAEQMERTISGEEYKFCNNDKLQLYKLNTKGYKLDRSRTDQFTFHSLQQQL